MRRLIYVVLAIIVAAGMAWSILASRGASADDNKEIAFIATNTCCTSNDPEGSTCSIGRRDGPFPGWTQQVIMKDADGAIVGKQTLLNGKVNSDLHCEVRFSMTFPDSSFATIYVDEDRVVTFAKSDIETLQSPVNLFIP